VRDRGVVRGSVREHFLCQQTPQLKIVVVRFESSENPGVIGRIDDHRHRLEILRRRPKSRLHQLIVDKLECCG